MESDRVQRAWENCVEHGDSEETVERLDPGAVSHEYVSWDEMAIPEGSAPFPDDRPWDPGAILHVLFAADEETLVREPLRVGALLEGRAAEIRRDLREAAL